jgi:hypothetical protein
MTIETIEQQLSATRDTLAKLEAELAALKKPAEVKYRPAEFPRDWMRTEVGGEVIVGHCGDSVGYPWVLHNGMSVRAVLECCVPIREGDEYREPVLPGDRMAAAEFSFDGVEWVDGRLCSYACQDNRPWCDGMRCYKFARIRTGATE